MDRPEPYMDTLLWYQHEFEEFNAENPQVYEELVALARQLKEFGHSQYSIKGLWEVLRHRRALETTGNEFKLNNNFTAPYARRIMEQEPDLVDFFGTRISKYLRYYEDLGNRICT